MPDWMHHALRAQQAPPARGAAPPRHALVVGAAGALGSALLEQALGSGGFAQVAVLVDEPIAPALRGFVALHHDTLALGLPLAVDTAFVVFDRTRHAHGREDAFHRPVPAALPALARSLHRCGVRRLLVVLPHAPALLPDALKRGLASLDEQAVAAVGFEQLLIVRSAQAPDGARSSAPWLQRVAHAMLAQLHWMVPQQEQPVRPAKVAALAVALAQRLPAAAPGTRVVPPEMVWRAAQPGDIGPLVDGWLGLAQG